MIQHTLVIDEHESYYRGVTRFNERNERERISNGGQVLLDDHKSSGTGL